MVNLIKTLLKVYPRISEMTERLDRLIAHIAFNSYMADSDFACRRILKLMNKKTRLINLKCILESTTAKLKKDERDIAEILMTAKKTKDYCGFCGVSMRTVFRKKRRMLEGLEKALKFQGFDGDYFDREYGDFAFVRVSKAENAEGDTAGIYVSGQASGNLYAAH